MECRVCENKEKCPCTSMDCANHGICCECLRSHQTKDHPAACQR